MNISLEEIQGKVLEHIRPIIQALVNEEIDRRFAEIGRVLVAEGDSPKEKNHDK